MTSHSGPVRRLTRHPLTWVALAVAFELLILVPSLDTLGDEPRLSVFLQWQNGPFLGVLVCAGLVAEVLWRTDKALGWGASLLLLFGLYQFRYFVLMVVFFHPYFLVGVCSMLCVFVASGRTLFGSTVRQDPAADDPASGGR